MIKKLLFQNQKNRWNVYVFKLETMANPICADVIGLVTSACTMLVSELSLPNYHVLCDFEGS